MNRVRNKRRKWIHFSKERFLYTHTFFRGLYSYIPLYLLILMTLSGSKNITGLKITCFFNIVKQFLEYGKVLWKLKAQSSINRI